MKILYISDHFDFLGGAEVNISRLAKYMLNKGHIVYFASASTSTAGNEYFNITYKKQRTLFNRTVPFWNIRDPEAYKATKKIIEKVNPDIIHFNKLELLTLAPLIAAKNNKIPRLMTVRDPILICPKHYRLKPDGKFCKEKNWKRCSPLCSGRNRRALEYEMNSRFKILQDEIVVTPSNYLKKIYEEFGWRGKILTIPNGIETEFFYPNYNQSNSVLWIGRSGLEKGPKYFLSAAEIVKKKRPNTNFIMITDKKGVSRLASWAVKIIDWMPNRRLIDYYTNSCMLVMTSLYETFPTVVLESMACGKPIVAFEIGGVKEIVDDGKNGFLVEKENYFDLSEKIFLLLEDQDLAIKMGKNARDKVEKKYSIEITAKEYEKLYENLIAS